MVYPLRGEGNDDAVKGQDLMVPSLLPETCPEQHFADHWPPLDVLQKQLGIHTHASSRTRTRTSTR